MTMTAVVLLMAVGTAPWLAFEQTVSTSNPCYQVNEKIFNQNKRKVDARAVLAQMGSMIVCPCLEAGLNFINANPDDTVVSLSNTVASVEERTRANFKESNRRIEEGFTKTFRGATQATSAKHVNQLARYHATTDDIDTWVLAFMFEDEIRPLSKSRVFHRPYGGPFTLDADLFHNYLVVPATQDETFMNVTRLTMPDKDRDIIDEYVDSVWVSHSTALCYDLLVSALVYEDNKERIAPPLKPVTPPGGVIPKSVSEWENHCTSYDCGFNWYTNQAGGGACPGPGCAWCTAMAGTKTLEEMFTLPADTGIKNKWEQTDKNDIWGSTHGHAGTISIRKTCAADPTCTGYYWGTEGACLSSETDAPKEHSSSSKAAQAKKVKKHTFPFLYRYRGYNETNVAFNFGAGVHVTQRSINKREFMPTSPTVSMQEETNYTRIDGTRLIGPLTKLTTAQGGNPFILSEATEEARIRDCRITCSFHPNSCKGFVITPPNVPILNGSSYIMASTTDTMCALYNISEQSVQFARAVAVAPAPTAAPTPAPAVVIEDAPIPEFDRDAEDGDKDARENGPNRTAYDALPELAGLPRPDNSVIQKKTTIRQLEGVVTGAQDQITFVYAPMADGYETLAECQTACLLSEKCSSCQEVSGGTFVPALLGQNAKDITKVYFKVDVNTAGACRRHCWDSEDCLAWSWGNTAGTVECKIITSIGGIGAGTNANIGALETLGFSTTQPCTGVNHAFDLCTQRCVDIHKHIDAGWCNHNWVNCLAGPFSTSNAPGKQLCTGSYMTLDGHRGSMEQFTNNELSSTIDGNNGAFLGDKNNGACLSGAGAPYPGAVEDAISAKTISDDVYSAADASSTINYIGTNGSSSAPPSGMWGSATASTACVGSTPCIYGKCIFQLNDAPVMLLSSTGPMVEGWVLQPNNLKFTLFDDPWQAAVFYRCPDFAPHINIDKNSERKVPFNSACCSVPFQLGGTGQCFGGQLANPELFINPKGCQDAINHISLPGIIFSGGSLPDNKIYPADYHKFLAVQLDNAGNSGPLSNTDNLYSCRSYMESELRIDQLKHIYTPVASDEIGDINTFDHKFVCPLGVTHSHEKPISEQDIHLLTIKCPYNKPYKTARAQRRTDIKGRCGYTDLNNDFADPGFSTAPYYGADVQQAARCEPIDYVCSETATDDTCGTKEAKDNWNDGACGVVDNADAHIYDKKQIRHSTGMAFAACKNKPIDVCEKDGHVLRWAETSLNGQSIPMCVPLVAASETKLYPATHSQDTQCRDYIVKGDACSLDEVSDQCVPLACASRSSEQCNVVDLQHPKASSCVLSGDTCGDNPDLPDIHRAADACIADYARYWPGFVHANGHNAGAGPAWFNSHTECDTADACGGVNVNEPVTSLEDTEVAAVENCQRELFEQRFTTNAQGSVFPSGSSTVCASHPTKECLGGSHWTKEGGQCSCTAKPGDEQFQSTASYFELGASAKAECGPYVGHVFQDYGWENYATLTCQGMDELLTSSMWNSDVHPHNPSCGCRPVKNTAHVFRKTVDIDVISTPELTVNEGTFHDCKVACGAKDNCGYCAIDKDTNTIYTVDASFTPVPSTDGALEIYAKTKKDDVVPCCDPTTSCAHTKKSDVSYTWDSPTTLSAYSYACDDWSAASLSMAKYKCIGRGESCTGFALKSGVYCAVKSDPSSTQVDNYYKITRGTETSVNCPPHAVGCVSGVSTCNDASCTACKCQCEQGFTGTLCDACADPNKDPSSGCKLCIGNFVKTEAGDCAMCKPGFDIASACKDCLPHYAPNNVCDTYQCEITDDLSGTITPVEQLPHVLVAYDVNTNKQLFDGTKGLSLGIIPEALRYSMVHYTDTTAAGTKYFWLTKDTKYNVDGITGDRHGALQVFENALIHDYHSDWINSIPLAPAPLTIGDVMEWFAFRGHACYGTREGSEILGTETTADQCASSCAADHACAGWFHRGTSCNRIMPPYTNIEWGTLTISYECQNGGFVASGPDRNVPGIDEVYSMYFTHKQAEIVPVNDLHNMIVKDSREIGAEYWFMGKHYRQKLLDTEVDGTDGLIFYVTQVTSDPTWEPPVISLTWLESLPIHESSVRPTRGDVSAYTLPTVTGRDYQMLEIDGTAIALPESAVTNEQTSNTASECCKVCNGHGAYWHFEGTTCRCYSSVSGAPELDHVQPTCYSDIGQGGTVYSVWDRGNYPNGCLRAVQVEATAQYTVPDICGQVVSSTAHPTLDECKKACVAEVSCKIASYKGTQCEMYDCLNTDWVADASSTLLVKKGGCAEERLDGMQVCAYVPPKSGIAGPLGERFCSAFGDSVHAESYTVNTYSGKEAGIRTDGTLTSKSEIGVCNIQNWTAATLWPLHETTVPFGPLPIVISSVTDRLWLNSLGYTKQFSGTSQISVIPVDNVARHVHKSDIIPISQTQAKFDISPTATADFDQLQFRIIGTTADSSVDACFLRAESAVQMVGDTGSQFSGVQCNGDVCTEPSINAAEFNAHIAQDFYEQQKQCHDEANLVQYRPKEQLHVVIQPPGGWTTVSLTASNVYLPLDQKIHINIGTPSPPEGRVFSGALGTDVFIDAGGDPNSIYHKTGCTSFNHLKTDKTFWKPDPLKQVFLAAHTLCLRTEATHREKCCGDASCTPSPNCVMQQTAELPAPPTPVPGQTPPPTPPLAPTPVPAVEQAQEGPPCLYISHTHRSMPSPGSITRLYAPTNMGTCTEATKEDCLKQCSERTLCTVVEQSPTPEFTLWSLHMTPASGIVIPNEMYIDTPGDFCAPHGVREVAHVTTDAGHVLWVKKDCCFQS